MRVLLVIVALVASLSAAHAAAGTTKFPNIAVTGTASANGVVATNSITLAGTTLTNWIWNALPTGTDTEGGTVYGAQTLNPWGNGSMQFAVNHMTNFWGSSSTCLSIGDAVADPVLMATDNADIFNIGDSAGFNANLSRCYDFHNYGSQVGCTVFATNCFALINIGSLAGCTVTANDSYDVVNWGFTGNGSTYVSSGNIFNYGNNAGSGVNLTNSLNVTSFGDSAGRNLAGSYTNIYLFGDSAQPTRTSDQMVFGSASTMDYRFAGTNTLTMLGTVRAATLIGTNGVTTGAPSGGGSSTWKLGSLRTCSAVTMVVTNYIEVEIGGVTNAIPILRITP